MLFQRTIALLAVSALSTACAYNANHAADEVKKQQDVSTEKYQQAQSITPTVPMAQYHEGLWLGGGAFRLSEADTLPSFFSQEVVFNQIDPISFQDLVSVIGSDNKVRTTLSNDALDYLKTANTQNQQTTQSGGQFDPAILNFVGNAPAQDARFSLRYAGSLIGLLDLVASRANVFWRWDHNKIIFFRQLTKTFVLDSLAGQMVFSAEIKSGSGLNKSALSKQSTVLTSNPPSIWKSVLESIQAMSSKTGRVAVSEQLGTITITDTPLVLKNAGNYIKRINLVIGQPIAIKTQVYEVTIENNDDLGLSADFFYNHNSASYLAALLDTAGDGVNQLLDTDGVPSQSNGSAFGVQILSPSSDVTGSSAFVKAVKKYGKVSLVTSSTSYTVNGVPVPVQVLNEISYLARVSISNNSGGLTGGAISQTELEPGVTTEGFSLTLLPKLMSSGKILLQIAADLASINKIENFSAGGLTIQLPNRSTKDFLQRVSIRSGQTLMISGFERIENKSDTEALASEGTWFLGGKKKGGTKRVSTVILITPYLMAND